MELQRRQHYLVATFPFQGHINPALHLAKNLALTVPGARVTFSTSLSGHRRMFPSSLDSHSDDLLSYAPYSDGFDDGNTGGRLGFNRYMVEFKASGSRTFSRLIADLAADGRPVTCVLYTMLLPWAADVARDHGIPSFHYWIQPAAIFAIYYHYFHDHGALVDAHREDPSFVITLPGLPQFQIHDLPPFLTAPADHPLSSILGTLREAFAVLDWERNALSSLRPRVLVNTFDELELRAIAAVPEVEILTVGPLIPSRSSSGGDIFKPDDKGYGHWLDAKPERSVVYVSFGSLHRCSALELEKLAAGLEATGRPYLWVVRKDDREAAGAAGLELKGPRRMVVEWCAQVRVLSHAAVGCFVTHCGWNSTLESLACGVPTVGVPRMSDQLSNAKMAKDEWGTGVTAEIGADGVVPAEELRRCVETVMGEESGEWIRKRAQEWKERASAAVSEGGSSDRNLRAFLRI